MSCLTPAIIGQARKLFPWYPYWTCAQSRIMDEFEQNQEVLRGDVNQLKEKVDKIIETLQSLEKRSGIDGNPLAINEEPCTIPTHPPGFTLAPPSQYVNQGAMIHNATSSQGIHM